jgi:hypothetical protein
MSDKKQITISSVDALLKAGKSRKEIAEHFGETMAEMNRLVWSHPKLKGRKMIKQKVDSIELIDDEDGEEVQEIMAVGDVDGGAEAEEPEVEETEEAEETQAPTTVTDWK